jgi:thioredoxin-related protein
MTKTLTGLQGWIQVLGGRLTAVAVALVAVSLVAASPARAADRWLTSYEEALEAAEETDRPILTIFTGSDWCPHCRTLEEKVLHTETFSRWAEGRVVLLMIDLPQHGISQEERHARSRVCIKYGVRTFPTALLIGPDGSRITAQSGYTGQAADAWVASMDGHLPAVAGNGARQGEKVLSSLDDAVETAKDAKRPILLMVSRPTDPSASTRIASLIKDPEFEAFAKDHFVVATVPPEAAEASPQAEALENLLGGVDLPAEGVELIVTDDGQTPLFSQSGTQPPHRIVTGLRRFLAARQSVRR